MTTASLVVVGSVNADLMVHTTRHPLPGETLLGSGGQILPGGKGANQATAAALQGAHVTFLGAVGTDPYAEAALSLMESSGVDLSAVARIPDVSTGLAVVMVADSGENSILVIPGANAQVTGEFVMQRREVIDSASMVVLQGEIPASGVEAAVRLARGAHRTGACGAETVGQPEDEARVIINLAPVIKIDPAVLLCADPIIANEHEAGLILSYLSATRPTSPAGQPDSPAVQPDSPARPSDRAALAQALYDAGFSSVVLTLGAAGALVVDAEGLTEIPTPRVKAVDTTGAGDAFTGALAAYLLADNQPVVPEFEQYSPRARALREAALHAARVGAFAASRVGARTSYPSVNEELPLL